MPDFFLCVPEDYYSEAMQEYIQKSCNDIRNAWIYTVIDGNVPPSEIVLERTADWTLCRDVHAPDSKWLVVVHDTGLRSIRDLRRCHVPMLRQLQKHVRRALQTHLNTTTPVRFFLHHLPSTFQLHVHAHVEAVGDDRIHSRRHDLKHVVRNLELDDHYYTKCILIANVCKTTKAAGVHSAMSSQAVANLLYKHT